MIACIKFIEIDSGSHGKAELVVSVPHQAVISCGKGFIQKGFNKLAFAVVDGKLGVPYGWERESQRGTGIEGIGEVLLELEKWGKGGVVCPHK